MSNKIVWIVSSILCLVVFWGASCRQKEQPKLTPEKMAKANKLLEQGREDLNIVQYGNGVHNKKYSIMLIDAAITSFEDLIDFLEQDG